MLFSFVLSKFKRCRFLCSLSLYFLSFSLLIHLFTVFDAKGVTLSWDMNSESDLGGYYVNYGGSTGNYTNKLDVGNITNKTISVPDDDTTFFAVTAYDVFRNESVFSNEVIFTGSVVNEPAVVNNTSPVAVNDTITTEAGHATKIDVLANDSDTEDGVINPSTVMIVTQAGNGGTVVNFDGTITYTPGAGFSGTDSFIYKIADNDGATDTATVTITVQGTTSNAATVTVTASPSSSSFFDDFSINTTGNYTVTDTSTLGGFGSFRYDSIGDRAQVLTGDNISIQFSHDLPVTDNGTFSIDFLPTVKYPSNGRIRLRLVQDANNYYQLRNSDGSGPLEVKKVIGGLEVDSAPFLNGYLQGTTNTITVSFSPNQTTVNAFGELLTINTNVSSIMVNSFELITSQQDAFYDNIAYIDNISANGSPASVNQPPTAVDDSATTTQDIAVNVNVIANDTDIDGIVDPVTVTVGNQTSGTAAANLDGTVTYTPNPGFTGTGTFTYTVQDDLGATSNAATVTMTVTASPSSSGLVDDFSTDTTGDYTVTDTWTGGGFGSFRYDAIGQRVQVLTGDNIGIKFARNLPPTDNGTFSIDFLPTAKYPSSGKIRLRLGQDVNNYYQLRNSDGKGPLEVKKVIGGLEVDSAPFLNGYLQGTTNTITINFSPNNTTVNAFGNVVTINTDINSIMVNSLEIETRQQDAFYDNISHTDNTIGN